MTAHFLRVQAHVITCAVLLVSAATVFWSCAGSASRRPKLTEPPAGEPGAPMAAINSENLKHNVEQLVSFQSRFAFSEGNAKAADWIKSQFDKIAAASILPAKAEFQEFPVKWRERQTVNRNVFITLRGRKYPQKAVVVGAHYDSTNWKDAPPEANAPGANDDGSGTAVVIELARVFAQREFDYTLVCVAFSAEELGLLGSKAFVPFLKERGIEVVAMMTNDMIGNIEDETGALHPSTVRVYSAENSRTLARLAATVCRETFGDSFSVILHDAVDRPGRGGDHKPFSDAGIPAIRIIETGENTDRQHTAKDLIESMDFEYLLRVAQLNAALLRRLLNEGFVSP